MATDIKPVDAGTLIRGRDVTRWLTFSTFWGSVSYLLACASLAGASRRQPVRVNAGTTLLGLGIHVASFVALGSATAATAAFVRQKPTTQISTEEISGGSLEQPKNIISQGLGAAAASVVPLALAVASQQAAERIAGSPAIGKIDDMRWLRAVAVMSALSGLTSLAVARITGWVARDARGGRGPRR
jgi:hypothetical protein